MFQLLHDPDTYHENTQAHESIRTLLLTFYEIIMQDHFKIFRMIYIFRERVYTLVSTRSNTFINQCMAFMRST